MADISRLTNEIRPDEKGLGGCTVPLAMLLFSLIDLFGFLMRPDQNANKRNARRNFEYLLSDSGYFSETYVENWKMILELFRHGVVHQFFPKASGITKAGPKVPLLFMHENIPHVNVDDLSSELVKVLNQIKVNIVSGNYPDIVVRMNHRLDELAKDDYNKLAEFGESE